MKSEWKRPEAGEKYNPDTVYVHSSKAIAIAGITDFKQKNYLIYNPRSWTFNMCCFTMSKTIYTEIEKWLHYSIKISVFQTWKNLLWKRIL